MSTTIVSCPALAANPQWRIFDCRHNLATPDQGQQLYRESHLPGALHVHLDRDLSGVITGVNGRHPLPPPEDFLALLGRLGLSPEDQVVIYDADGGMFAARLWWMLRWVGHRQVAVLDGGWPEWRRLGLPVTSEMPAFAPTRYPGQADDGWCVPTAVIEANLAQPAAALIDARAAERFAGRIEPLDPKAGHIPGALNRPCALNLAADGRFKAPAELQAELTALLAGRQPSAVIAMCGSGTSPYLRHHLQKKTDMKAKRNSDMMRVGTCILHRFL